MPLELCLIVCVFIIYTHTHTLHMCYATYSSTSARTYSSKEESLSADIQSVEIKYCTADTRPQPQQKRADLQHTALISALTKTRTNTEARLITINLGMAGYIYQDETEEQLQQLGINGQALNSLLTNLHVQAVKSLTRIVQARRKRRNNSGEKSSDSAKGQTTLDTASNHHPQLIIQGIQTPPISSPLPRENTATNQQGDD